MKQTWKKIIILVLCFALLSSMVVFVSAAEDPGYEISGTVSGAVGNQIFTVTIKTKGGIPTSVGRVALAFNGNQITPVGNDWNSVIQTGSGVSKDTDSNSKTTLFPPQASPDYGRIMFSWIGLFSGDSVIATIKFTLNPGVTIDDFNSDTLGILKQLPPQGMLIGGVIEEGKVSVDWFSSTILYHGGGDAIIYIDENTAAGGSLSGNQEEIGNLITYTGSTKYPIEFTVQDSNGAVVGATVSGGGGTAVTGSDGKAILYLETGDTVTISKTGYTSKTETVGTLSAPGSMTITITKTGGGTPPGPGGPSGPSEPEEPEEPIDALYRKAFMNGYTNGTFMPNGDITRAEIATIIARIIYGDVNLDKKYPTGFTDTNEEAWYADYVGYVRQLSIMTGDGNGSFRPDDKITREEFAKVACETAKHMNYIDVIEIGTPNFKDTASISQWAIGYIYTAQKHGWMTGDTNQMVTPKQNLTRAAAAKIIDEMQGRLLNADSIKGFKFTNFPDLESGSWYYYYVIAAINDYAYIKDSIYDQWVQVEVE